MEMNKLGVLTSFLHNIVVYNIPLLYGTVGEIVVEKSGSLNLGVEGIMAVGAIFGYIAGCYANSLGVGIAAAFLMGALCGLLFAALTVSLQANQNITGLTLTTFGLGVYFFVGNGLKAKAWPVMGEYENIKQGFASLPIPVLSEIPLLCCSEYLAPYHYLAILYKGIVNRHKVFRRSIFAHKYFYRTVFYIKTVDCKVCILWLFLNHFHYRRENNHWI